MSADSLAQPGVTNIDWSLACGLMRPDVGEVLHFSEDPSISAFAPHVAATAKDPTAFVWAVGHSQAPSYWFPRQCPRAMAWLAPSTTRADRDRILGSTNSRVHLVEYAWL